VLLPGSGGFLQLQRAGGTPVLRADLHRCPPHLHFRDGAARQHGAALGYPCGRIGVGDDGPNLIGQRADQVGSGGQIVPPHRMVAQPLRDAGEPRQRALAGVPEIVVVEPPVQNGGSIVGGAEFPGVGDSGELGDRVGAVRGEQQQMGTEGGPGRLVDQAGHNLLGRDI
jgi:hypothetical protein